MTEETISNAVLFNKTHHGNKRQRCPLSVSGAPTISYKNIELLTKYISEKGRILPSRISGVSAKKQRELKVAIKRARAIALLPFTAT